MGLLLQALDVAGPWRWRWLLTDEASGAALADHTVAVDPADEPEAAGFEDLPGFLRRRADPTRRVESEAELVAQVGAWAGERLLGQTVGDAIAAAAPATVRVRVPESAGWLLFAPWELAYAGGLPLARRGDVSLVFDVGAATAGGAARGADAPLRMVAVFSLPTETRALGLRRE
ncbi:MAG: AAA family ATPase, partial [Actinobacteria bacterium]